MHHRRMQLLQNHPPKWNHRSQNRQIDDNQPETLAPQYHSSRQLDPQVRETNEDTTSMGTANTSSIAPSTNIKTEREDSTRTATTNRKNTSTHWLSTDDEATLKDNLPNTWWHKMVESQQVTILSRATCWWYNNTARRNSRIKISTGGYGLLLLLFHATRNA